jgi:hypothetical protein
VTVISRQHHQLLTSVIAEVDRYSCVDVRNAGVSVAVPRQIEDLRGQLKHFGINFLIAVRT